jgi:hypothetical protein
VAKGTVDSVGTYGKGRYRTPIDKLSCKFSLSPLQNTNSVSHVAICPATDVFFTFNDHTAMDDYQVDAVSAQI